MNRTGRLLRAGACCVVLTAMAAADGELWDGPKLKPVARQEVYEFAKSSKGRIGFNPLL